MPQRHLTALIPVKGRNPKSRLSPLLTLEQRACLTDWMLRRVLRAVRAVEHVNTMQLIGSTENRSLQNLALEEAVAFCPERASSLNGALQAEMDRCLEQGQRVLIVFADLPLIDVNAISELIAQSRHDVDLILAPDIQQQGTNALLYQGTQPLKLVYGASSFERFQQQARAKRLKAHAFSHPALAHDLDTPTDWQVLLPHLAKLGFSLEVCAETSRG